MKKIALPGLLILLAFTSCKKDDMKESATVASSSGVSTSAASASDWTAIQNWSVTENNYQASISDKNITPAITSEGLVLLYAKGKTIQSLPGQLENTYLYYQVQDSSIKISGLVKQSSAFDKNLQFSHIIFSAPQLKQVEEKGITKSQLLKMDYQQAKELKN